MEKITIRCATEADYPRLLELFAEFAEFEKLPEMMVNTLPRMQAESEYLNCFVAVNSEGNVIGMPWFSLLHLEWQRHLHGRWYNPDTGAAEPEPVYWRPIWGKRRMPLMRWQVADWNRSAARFYESLGAVRSLATGIVTCSLTRVQKGRHNQSIYNNFKLERIFFA